MNSTPPAGLDVSIRDLTEVLCEISVGFIDLPAEEFDAGVTEALRRVALLIQTDRASLAQVNGEGLVRVTQSWNAPGIKPLREMYSTDQLTWIGSCLLKGEPACFERPGDIPEEAPERRIVQLEGIKSHISLPLMSHDGKLIGALAMANLRRERPWPPRLRERLRLLADMFSYALDRKLTEGRRREALAELIRFKEQLEMENRSLRQTLAPDGVYVGLVGRSPQLRQVLSLVDKVAPKDSVVLVMGETGTGKELVANAIHANSPRGRRPMVKVNCAALPSTLVESELFGREKGAYTGAMTRQAGRFELADGSTLLLDEVGDLPLDLQAKLLRVLEEGQFERLGSSKTITVDVRLLASTNRDLPALVKQGAFRQDLFFRLDVFPITVPPLRERREDIPLLVWTFVDEFGQAMGRSVETISDATMDRLVAHPWPGNVRELKNVIERAMILKAGRELKVEIPAGPVSPGGAPKTLDEVQREQILRVLDTTAWRIRGSGAAAEILGIPPTTLESRMKRLGIRRHHAP